MGFIYKITNKINGKMYIGKTLFNNPVDRWKEHLQDYKRIKNEKRPLYSAMKKYGPENFDFEVLEETDNTEERERFYIEHYHTYVGDSECKGYNATLGGDGKPYLKLDENDVINYHINYASRVLGDTANHFGVDCETIKKILIRNDIAWLKKNHAYLLSSYIKTGGVAKIDPETNEIVDMYENTASANVEIKKERSQSNISNACRGIRNHKAYGYIWYYIKDLPDDIWNKHHEKLIEKYNIG